MKLELQARQIRRPLLALLAVLCLLVSSGCRFEKQVRGW
jgi:hypothetical protein